MFPRSCAALAAASATLIPAAVAHAGQVTLDLPCYVEQQTMIATGTGFTPNEQLTLSGDGVFGNATADASGNFQVPLQAPINPTIDAKPSSIQNETLNVEDFNDTTQNTSVNYLLTNYAVDRSSGSNPRSTRTWRFAGFQPGVPIYAHFRYKHKTQSNYRMGVPKAPCGTLTKRAPGIVARHIKTGTWTIQIDQRKTYSAETRPNYTFKVQIFLTFRPR
jgi:hypothetical protein